MWPSGLQPMPQQKVEKPCRTPVCGEWAVVQLLQTHTSAADAKLSPARFCASSLGVMRFSKASHSTPRHVKHCRALQPG